MSAGFVAEHTLLTCFASVPLSYGTRCHSLTFPPGRPLRIEAEERLCQLRDINARHVSRHPQWRGHCYPQFLHARPDRQAWKAVSAILRMGSHEVGDNDSLTACGHVDKILNVVVTGANRGLGFAIADGMLALGHRVVLACRDQREGVAALNRLRECGGAERASFHRLDVTCSESVAIFRHQITSGELLGGKVDILFNNAGVCLPEEGEGQERGNAERTVVGETLSVNFYGALAVIDACLPAMNTIAKAGRGTTTHESTIVPSVVWISSGEGELCFLGSKWRGLLGNSKSLEETKAHLLELAIPPWTPRPTTSGTISVPQGNDKKASDPRIAKNKQEALNDSQEVEGKVVLTEELAYGSTPAYSLSKAAVNTAVRTWAPRLASEHGVRLVAVCPGDVLTRMASLEEIARGEAISPEKAALAVVDVALRAADFPAGRFYRSGKEIDW